MDKETKPCEYCEEHTISNRCAEWQCPGMLCPCCNEYIIPKELETQE